MCRPLVERIQHYIWLTVGASHVTSLHKTPQPEYVQLKHFHQIAPITFSQHSLQREKQKGTQMTPLPLQRVG